MPSHDHDRLVNPRMTHVSDHDAQLGEGDRDVVEQQRVGIGQAARIGEDRALMDHHRQPEAFGGREDPHRQRVQR